MLYRNVFRCSQSKSIHISELSATYQHFSEIKFKCLHSRTINNKIRRSFENAWIFRMHRQLRKNCLYSATAVWQKFTSKKKEFNMDLNSLDISRNHCNEFEFLVSLCRKCVRYVRV